jgi:hypothetical protein
MNVRRSLWPDERAAYRSAIYKRATYRSMIRDHNDGGCPLSPHHIDQVSMGIVHMGREARGILAGARARSLGYTR